MESLDQDWISFLKISLAQTEVTGLDVEIIEFSGLRYAGNQTRESQQSLLASVSVKTEQCTGLFICAISVIALLLPQL